MSYVHIIILFQIQIYFGDISCILNLTWRDLFRLRALNYISRYFIGIG